MIYTCEDIMFMHKRSLCISLVFIQNKLALYLKGKTNAQKINLAIVTLRKGSLGIGILAGFRERVGSTSHSTGGKREKRDPMS